jgi:F-type H+-transporting ATPase subunit c
MIVSKFVQIAMFGLVAFASASVGMAQEATAGLIAQTSPMSYAAIGTGLVVIGAAYGIGKLAGSALESMARQPEVAGAIQTAMIIAAALIEGFTFFALYICMQSIGK